MIYINSNGTFFSGKVETATGTWPGSAASFWGIKPEQVSAFIILPELVHAAGGMTHGDNPSEFNEKLRDKCFKKQ